MMYRQGGVSQVNRLRPCSWRVFARTFPNPGRCGISVVRFTGAAGCKANSWQSMSRSALNVADRAAVAPVLERRLAGRRHHHGCHAAFPSSRFAPAMLTGDDIEEITVLFHMGRETHRVFAHQA